MSGVTLKLSTPTVPTRQRSKSFSGLRPQLDMKENLNSAPFQRPKTPLNLSSALKSLSSEPPTPPSSRRTSNAKPDQQANINQTYKFPPPPPPTLTVTVSDIDNDDTTNTVEEPKTPQFKTPVFSLASPPRQSRRHQRANSDAGLFCGQEPEDSIPGYQKSTALSRSRSRVRAPSISQNMPSETRSRRDSSTKGSKPTTNPQAASGKTVDSPQDAASEIPITSTFKATINATNTNIMQISTDPSFRLEIRLVGAANIIEVVAVRINPLPDVPSTSLIQLTPPVSPSSKPILDKDIDAVDPELGLSTDEGVDIPALNISAPTELECTSPESVVEVAQEIPSPPASTPRSTEQHLEVVSKFVEKRDIAEFFRPSLDPTGTDQGSNTEDFKTGFLEALATRAAALTKKLEETQNSENGSEEDNSLSFIKDVSTVADVVKLSLYDHVVLCDDSSSMTWYNNKNVDSLKSCLKSISKIAIALTEPLPNVDDNNTSSTHGISIRFLNHTDSASMDNLTSLADIEKAFSKVPFYGNTRLGRKLRERVLKPFLVNPIEQEKRRLQKPLLVTIITDGEPTDEPRDELKKTILWAKEYMQRMGYGRWAVGFHIAQVGESTDARKFLRELEEDNEINEHIYVSRENEDRTGWIQAKNNDLLWVNALLKAIEH